MSMNSPKVFIAAFCFTALILLTLLKLFPATQSTKIEGTVVNQTLTQSLDGHRRFLNITTSNNQGILIQTDPKVDCPKGSKVTIKQESGLISSVSSYQLVKCLPTE
ncbi:hypothetical protein [Vibrio sp. TBV020]|uniref:hypothetical protein n=1 Tax=Vibrio sp. TBV020 TaxID=3137398 RepID=UPI0038CDA678